MRYIVIILIALMIAGCGITQQEADSEYVQKYYNLPTNLNLTKTQEILSTHMETSPFVWNGKIKYLLALRDANFGYSRLQIVDFETGAVEYEFGEGLGLPSAIVHNGKILVFGTTEWNKPNEVYMLTSDDNFQSRKLVYTAPGHIIFNTSVCHDGNRFVMTYETNEITSFSTRFLVSEDLENWSRIETIFNPYIYSACPTIRYVNGYYYLWWLHNYNQDRFYVTMIARSANLTDWECSSETFLAPSSFEENNTSDMDIVEYNGITYFFYAIGNQLDHAGVTYATATKNLQEIVEEIEYN